MCQEHWCLSDMCDGNKMSIFCRQKQPPQRDIPKPGSSVSSGLSCDVHYGSNTGPGLLLHDYTQCCWLQLHVPALGEHGACISAPTDTASVRYPNPSALGTEGGRNTLVFCVSPAEGSPWLGQPMKPPVTAGDVCLCLWERCSALPPAQPAKRKAAAMSQPGQGLGLGGLLHPYQLKPFYDIFYRKKKKKRNRRRK